MDGWQIIGNVQPGKPGELLWAEYLGGCSSRPWARKHTQSTPATPGWGLPQRSAPPAQRLAGGSHPAHGGLHGAEGVSQQLGGQGSCTWTQMHEGCLKCVNLEQGVVLDVVGQCRWPWLLLQASLGGDDLTC
jgi:hypothetical protein